MGQQFQTVRLISFSVSLVVSGVSVLDLAVSMFTFPTDNLQTEYSTEQLQNAGPGQTRIPCHVRNNHVTSVTHARTHGVKKTWACALESRGRFVTEEETQGKPILGSS